MITKEKYGAMANALLQRFFKLSGDARLNNSTRAKLIGVSPIWFSMQKDTLEHKISAYTFLRLKQAVAILERGLAEGWLPCSAYRGAAQKYILDRLLAEE